MLSWFKAVSASMEAAGDMNCLLSNWKTPTEFRSVHLDRQINKRNGECVAMKMLWKRAGPLSICIIKIKRLSSHNKNPSWSRNTKCPFGSRVQVSFIFHKQTYFLELWTRDFLPLLFSLSKLKSSVWKGKKI